ncbi:MAG: glycine zipper domain-containing protein [Aquificaceae bacterium]|nr:glycine zipper domain-containing protein [Aquificaceae bacterium]MDW8237422.1 glycine zipper 2TM domain-containing protein [Aquificaceae bacterium]
MFRKFLAGFVALSLFSPAFAQATKSCEAMLDSSPKASLSVDTAKNVGVGALVGGAIGAMLDESNRLRGAIIGGIIGAFGGTLFSAAKSESRFLENYEKAAKRYNYSPAMGEFIAIETFSPRDALNIGQYANLIVRVVVLTPDGGKSDVVHPVTIRSYLKQGGYLMPLGSENYYFQNGATPLVYNIPICNIFRPGEYSIVFEGIGFGKRVSNEVVFRVN